MRPIEFFEIPDESKIELTFRDGKTKEFRCRTDFLHTNVVSEVYDEFDEVIATSMIDLKLMGAISARIMPIHEIEVD